MQLIQLMNINENNNSAWDSNDNNNIIRKSISKIMPKRYLKENREMLIRYHMLYK